ncbi:MULTISPECIES: hypothetical protein [unclassified Kitasatospora]
MALHGVGGTDTTTRVVFAAAYLFVLLVWPVNLCHWIRHQRVIGRPD